jgi:hypothetical protein
VASAIGIRSDIVSTDQHEAMGIEQTSVQLLGSSEFYHLPVRLKYSNQGQFGKFARLNRILQRIHRDDAKHALLIPLVQEEGKRLGFLDPTMVGSGPYAIPLARPTF